MAMFNAGFAAFYTLDAALSWKRGEIGLTRPVIGLLATIAFLAAGLSQ